MTEGGYGLPTARNSMMLASPSSDMRMSVLPLASIISTKAARAYPDGAAFGIADVEGNDLVHRFLFADIGIGTLGSAN